MRIICLLSFLILTGCVRQERPKATSITPDHLDVAFYNVENLFDIYDDRRTLDDDYTEDGRREWGQGRYEKKLRQLSKVIQAMDHGSGLPAIIGLAEVENEDVVQELGEYISRDRYGVIHEDSKDQRGIDVALLYDKQFMDIVEWEIFRVQFDERNYTSRDILYTLVRLSNGEQLHLFVNHWPSRREGQQESEHRRLSAARTLKKKVDDIRSEYSDPKILIMGDFNDHPDNRSIEEVLDAKAKDSDSSNELVNLAYPLNAEGAGTYCYKGDWAMLDQIIVSDDLLLGKGLSVDKDLEVFQKDFMMYYDKNAKMLQPNRTYGRNYYGGFSDHLPLLLHLSNHPNQ